MTHRFLRSGIVALALGASAAQAADLGTYAEPLAICAADGSSGLYASASTAELREGVVRRMDEAKAAAASREWIYSSRPVFVWANETKAACGMAYGYLHYSVHDEETLRKCGCFHARMISYMH